jgi:hypothetical protein
MKAAEKWSDPVVDEIHEIRRQMLQDSGGTLRGLMDRLQESQKRYGKDAARSMAKELEKSVPHPQP